MRNITTKLLLLERGIVVLYDILLSVAAKVINERVASAKSQEYPSYDCNSVSMKQ